MYFYDGTRKQQAIEQDENAKSVQEGIEKILSDALIAPPLNFEDLKDYSEFKEPNPRIEYELEQEKIRLEKYWQEQFKIEKEQKEKKRTEEEEKLKLQQEETIRKEEERLLYLKRQKEGQELKRIQEEEDKKREEDFKFVRNRIIILLIILIVIYLVGKYF